MKKRRTQVTAVALAASVTLLAGCGDSGEATGSEDTIRFMTWMGLSGPIAFPDRLASMEAAVEAVNADGGIDGRQVELIACDTQIDPNKQVACAKEAVAENVVAVVGSSTFLQNEFTFDTLEKAGIPYIGNGISTPEITSDIAFGQSGLAGWAYGGARALLDAGAENVVVVGTENDSGHVLSDYFEEAVETLSGGEATSRTVYMPLTATDVTAQAAAAVGGGTDGVLFVSTPSQTVSFVRSARQQGYTGPIQVGDAALDADVAAAIEPVAGDLEVVHLTSPVRDTENLGIQTFVAQMEEYRPDFKPGDVMIYTWWATQVFFSAARMADTIDADGVLEVLRDAEPGSIDALEITPALPASASSPLPDHPNLGFNPLVRIMPLVGVGDPPAEFTDPFLSAG